MHFYCFFNGPSINKFPYSWPNFSKTNTKTDSAWVLLLGNTCLKLNDRWYQLCVSYILFFYPAIGPPFGPRNPYIWCYTCEGIASCCRLHALARLAWIALSDCLPGAWGLRGVPIRANLGMSERLWWALRTTEKNCLENTQFFIWPRTVGIAVLEAWLYVYTWFS